MIRGVEFRAIRRFNRVRSTDLASKLNLYRADLLKVEKGEAVPIVYLRALSEMIGIDMLKKENIEMLLKGIPEFYYQINSRRKKWRTPEPFSEEYIKHIKNRDKMNQ